MKGDKRKEITDMCPDGFEDELNEFIDLIVSEVNEIILNLEVEDISEIRYIEDAYTIASKLANSLHQ